MNRNALDVDNAVQSRPAAIKSLDAIEIGLDELARLEAAVHVRGVNAWDDAWIAGRDESYAPIIEAVKKRRVYGATDPTFSATLSPERRCSASHTTPIPPDPRGVTRSKGPAAMRSGCCSRSWWSP